VTDPEVIVVGAGLFGSIVARTLHDAGAKVVVVDDLRPDSGSRPSACLMKPSWFAGLGRDVHEPSLALLDRLYGVQTLQFAIPPTRAFFPVFRVAPENILRDPTVDFWEGTVEAVGQRFVQVDGMRFDANIVVVAAGVWTGKLLPVPGLTGKKGVSFLWRGQIPTPFIRPWAPYKQLVAFNQDPMTIWAGDGSAIKTENWTIERQATCLTRVAGATKLDPARATALTGIRPFVPKCKPCYLEEREPGLWIVTGGGKNGTIAAGWAAQRILEAVR
jgi:glycine/D-amino acid oxidase-like deaminating enzyme